ncbi:MopE-related protein [Sandaracinus amylolyticus]|uniref:MopE-related protein n=1 Tax=Sandaracinus amylolyticus TaxID=927083 RepID=UPI001F1E30C5|nr:MopE-related protein [Sandaracinus amylolyticus]UJR81726.1 Hypothetical protein I5071_37860 [Sandaracinus amylolyticus]
MLDLRGVAVLALVLIVACEAPPPDTAVDGGLEPDGGPALCVLDRECQNGVYCDGEERCMPGATDADQRGCVPAYVEACEPGYVCEEEARRCVTDCPVALDADGDGRIAVDCGGDDCDDTDRNRFPGNTEVCDAAGHDEDCNAATFGFVDDDGDGSASEACCNADDEGTTCGDDCNDGDSLINPRAGEACDRVDNNCDGVADEVCPCAPGAAEVCGVGEGACQEGRRVCVEGIFGECIGAVGPTEELCDGVDNDCDASVDEHVLRTYHEDTDGDGYGSATSGVTTSACSVPEGWASNTLDCDDARAGVSPASPEVCNDLDDDCDGTTDEGLRRVYHLDGDGDGFGGAANTAGATCGPPSASYVERRGDCDDARASASPVGIESCNGADDDCDGRTDEGVLRTFHRDQDGDGVGGATTSTGCTAPSGYVTLGGDCADTDAARHPGRHDSCNAIDDDCDGATDPGCTCTDGARRDCGTGPGGGAPTNVGECAIGSQICVGGSWGSCVGDVSSSAEVCDGLDQDCDGRTDEGTVVTTCLGDGDGDGYGAGAATRQCRDATRASAGYCPPGWTTTGGDCNDANASARPMATESCNAIDDDCDTTIDESTIATGCFPDADADTYGIGSATAQCRDATRSAHGFCPLGYTNRGGDCNDSSSAIRPGATEACNGRDDDCDAAADDGAGMICALGTVRAGTGAYGSCGSVAGTYACNAGCTSETFTPSPPSETCNGSDDDCDGAIDDAFECRQSSTGHACVTGCGTVGTRSCSGSCSFGGQTCRGTEICNGCDDDVDGTADDGFTCRLGETRSCTRACGSGSVTGTQRCLADCSGWSDCTATETCNGCDDDGDGSVDNGFFCPRNAITYCTTACGTAGQQICNDSCSAFTESACYASAESCNYCDDDGDSATTDASLANGIVTDLYTCSSFRAASTITTCTTITSRTYTLVNGAANDAGAIWLDNPAAMRRLGWGPMSFVAEVTAGRSASPTTYPADGWAVILGRNGSGDLGAIGGGLGVPSTRDGLVFEWRYYTGTPSSQSDQVQVVRQSGGMRTVLGTVTPPAGHLDSTSSSDVTQRLFIEYTPDDPRTVTSEERLRLRFTVNGPIALDVAPSPSSCGGSICACDPPCASPSLARELVPGEPFQIGFSAATGGAVSMARVELNGTIVGTGPYTRAQRSNVCF